jgi:hypothetical protein
MEDVSVSSSVMIVFFDGLTIPFSDSIVNLINPSVGTTDNILISFM